MRPTPDNRDSLYDPGDAEWVAPNALPRHRLGKGPSWLLNTLILAGVSWLSIIFLAPHHGHGGRRLGQLTACKSNLKNIGTALDLYSADHAGQYPPSMNELVPTYLTTVPQCPGATSMTYRVDFGLQAPMNSGAYEDYYYIECHGGHHEEVGVTGDYPAYNGVVGLIERSPGTGGVEDARTRPR